MLQYLDTARRASGQLVVAAGAFLKARIHEARKAACTHHYSSKTSICGANPPLSVACVLIPPSLRLVSGVYAAPLRSSSSLPSVLRALRVSRLSVSRIGLKQSQQVTSALMNPRAFKSGRNVGTK